MCICQIILEICTKFWYSKCGDILKNYIKLLKNYLNSSITLEYHSSLPSTNTYLKGLVTPAAKEGLLVIADNQTAGRGRFDRKFHSPADTGIYMSLLLKPAFSGFNATLVTTAAAAAVAEACETLSGKKAEIKWVNDVLIDDKKVCGILTEGSINPKTGLPDYVILGIGINAFAPKNGFAADIKDIAGSVFQEFDADLKAKLTANIINKFLEYYAELDKKSFLESYRSRSICLGKTVTVVKGDSRISAKVLQIDQNCCLLVEYENGTTETLSSGEISIKI